jgi:hypothetical protein
VLDMYIYMFEFRVVEVSFLVLSLFAMNFFFYSCLNMYVIPLLRSRSRKNVSVKVQNSRFTRLTRQDELDVDIHKHSGLNE